MKIKSKGFTGIAENPFRLRKRIFWPIASIHVRVILHFSKHISCPAYVFSTRDCNPQFYCRTKCRFLFRQSELRGKLVYYAFHSTEKSQTNTPSIFYRTRTLSLKVVSFSRTTWNYPITDTVSHVAFQVSPSKLYVGLPRSGCSREFQVFVLTPEPEIPMCPRGWDNTLEASMRLCRINILL